MCFFPYSKSGRGGLPVTLPKPLQTVFVIGYQVCFGVSGKWFLYCRFLPVEPRVPDCIRRPMFFSRNFYLWELNVSRQLFQSHLIYGDLFPQVLLVEGKNSFRFSWFKS